MYANPAYEEVEEVEQESLEARLKAAEDTTAALQTELQQALQSSRSLEEVSTRQALAMPAVCSQCMFNRCCQEALFAAITLIIANAL